MLRKYTYKYIIVTIVSSCHELYQWTDIQESCFKQSALLCICPQITDIRDIDLWNQAIGRNLNIGLSEFYLCYIIYQLQRFKVSQQQSFDNQDISKKQLSSLESNELKEFISIILQSILKMRKEHIEILFLVIIDVSPKVIENIFKIPIIWLCGAIMHIKDLHIKNILEEEKILLQDVTSYHTNMRLDKSVILRFFDSITSRLLEDIKLPSDIQLHTKVIPNFINFYKGLHLTPIQFQETILNVNFGHPMKVMNDFQGNILSNNEILPEVVIDIFNSLHHDHVQICNTLCLKSSDLSNELSMMIAQIDIQSSAYWRDSFFCCFYNEEQYHNDFKQHFTCVSSIVTKALNILTNSFEKNKFINELIKALYEINITYAINTSKDNAPPSISFGDISFQATENEFLYLQYFSQFIPNWSHIYLALTVLVHLQSMHCAKLIENENLISINSLFVLLISKIYLIELLHYNAINISDYESVQLTLDRIYNNNNSHPQIITIINVTDPEDVEKFFNFILQSINQNKNKIAILIQQRCLVIIMQLQRLFLLLNTNVKKLFEELFLNDSTLQCYYNLKFLQTGIILKSKYQNHIKVMKESHSLNTKYNNLLYGLFTIENYEILLKLLVEFKLYSYLIEFLVIDLSLISYIVSKYLLEFEHLPYSNSTIDINNKLPNSVVDNNNKLMKLQKWHERKEIHKLINQLPENSCFQLQVYLVLLVTL